MREWLRNVVVTNEPIKGENCQPGKRLRAGEKSEGITGKHEDSARQYAGRSV